VNPRSSDQCLVGIDQRLPDTRTLGSRGLFIKVTAHVVRVSEQYPLPAAPTLPKHNTSPKPTSIPIHCPPPSNRLAIPTNQTAPPRSCSRSAGVIGGLQCGRRLWALWAVGASTVRPPADVRPYPRSVAGRVTEDSGDGRGAASSY
jgi:hypothetical protein